MIKVLNPLLVEFGDWFADAEFCGEAKEVCQVLWAVQACPWYVA